MPSCIDADMGTCNIASTMKNILISPLIALVLPFVLVTGQAADPPVVPPREGKSETLQLFNGKDWEGWEGNMKRW